jgi:hypothetical protein
LTSRLSISILLLVTFAASAQEQDTVSQKRDTVKHDFRPTGLRFGTDVIAIIKSSTDKTFNCWELNGDIDFYRYYLAVDYGYWARDYTAYDAGYSNNGTYWRVGADVNFLTKDPDKNMFYFGLRYGSSLFSEKMVIQKVDPIWGDIGTTLTNSNLNAHWFELTTGLKVKMFKIIWMGYTVRLKFALDTDKTDDMIPSDVPGYGRADADSFWGFNYQIFVRIPVRKRDSIPLEK